MDTKANLAYNSGHLGMLPALVQLWWTLSSNNVGVCSRVGDIVITEELETDPAVKICDNINQWSHRMALIALLNSTLKDLVMFY